MKAIINGIECEGTPEEIHKLMVACGVAKSTNQAFVKTPEWMKYISTGDYVDVLNETIGNKFPYHLSINKSKCPSKGGACYCTGACMQLN